MKKLIILFFVFLLLAGVVSAQSIEECYASGLSSNSEALCVKDIAIENKDASICENINDYTIRYHCILETAMAAKNPDFCNYMMSDMDKDICKRRVITEHSLGIEECEKIEAGTMEKYECIMRSKKNKTSTSVLWILIALSAGLLVFLFVKLSRLKSFNALPAFVFGGLIGAIIGLTNALYTLSVSFKMHWLGGISKLMDTLFEQYFFNPDIVPLNFPYLREYVCVIANILFGGLIAYLFWRHYEKVKKKHIVIRILIWTLVIFLIATIIMFIVGIFIWLHYEGLAGA